MRTSYCYAVDIRNSDSQQWEHLGQGDTDDGAHDDIPDRVEQFANSGNVGTIEADEELYRVRRVD